MIDIEELRFFQAHFESHRKSHKSHYTMLENKRKEFVKKYDKQAITNLSIENFAVGKKPTNKESFCYLLEFETAELGRINGATSKKYGLYINKKTQEYIIKKAFSSPDDAMAQLKTSILELLVTGKTQDIEKIKKNILTPMVKGKILFMYYPKIYLNIFSEELVDYYLKKVDLYLGNENLNVIDKRFLLVKFKNEDSIMKTWNMFEFSSFLEYTFDVPVKRKNLPPELKEFADETYPDIKSVKPNVRIISTSDLADFFESTKIQKIKQKNIQRNYIRDVYLNTQRGERGEQIVIKHEKEFLKKAKRKDLAYKVKQISREDNAAGYDVLSYDENGNEKYIEVKATVGQLCNEILFHISEGERKKAKSLNNYWLYVVFNIKDNTPDIICIKNPAKLFDKQIKLIPEKYQGIINLKKIND